MKRHRHKQDRTLGERLIKEARAAREKADQLPPQGAERKRDDLLEKGPRSRYHSIGGLRRL